MTVYRFFNVAMGILIGGATGIAIGLLFAPRAGKEIREDLSETAKDTAERLKDGFESASRWSLSTYENLLQRLKKLDVEGGTASLPEQDVHICFDRTTE